MHEQSEELIQRFSRRYVAVLLIVAGLLVVDQAVVQPSLVSLNLYAPVINLAGRQRMLSQRLVKGALAIARQPGESETWRPELEDSLRSWTRTHQGLLSGDAEFDLLAPESPAIQRDLAQLTPHVAAMSEAVRQILAVPTDGDAPLASLLRHEGPYLGIMDGVVHLLEQEARNRVSRLRLLALAATLAALALLIALYGLVVQPATRLIRTQVHTLAASEARYRLLIERMHDGLAIVAADGNVLYVNDRFCRILARSREQLLGRSLAASADETSRGDLAALLDRAPGGADVLEVRWTLPDGRPCITLVAPGTSPAAAAPGRATAPVGTAPGSAVLGGAADTFLVVTEITPLKLAEQKLRDARDALEVRVAERTRELSAANEALAREGAERERAEERTRLLQTQLAHAARVTSLGELATGIAHEINQPLGAIANYSEALGVLAASPERNRSEIESVAGRLRDAAVRAGRIVSRMRNFVKSRAPDPSLELVNPLIEEVLSLCEPETRENGVRVARELDETAGETLFVDPIQFQQVLVNLVRNAVQAMSAAPSEERILTITSRVGADRIQIEVEDTGPGFPSETIPRTFQPFQSTKGDGLGMGLSISQTILASHGGALSAENRSPGGARLTLVFPKPHDSSSPRHPREPADGVRGR